LKKKEEEAMADFFLFFLLLLLQVERSRQRPEWKAPARVSAR
jgi:hypothetical protein